MLQDQFESAGFHVHYVTPKKDSLIKNIYEMARLIRKEGYAAVHVHLEEWSFLYLWIAKCCGVPVRICHAHMANMVGADTKLHYMLFRVLLNRFSTVRLACSKDAGNHLYGKNPYVVLHNAFDVSQYIFNEETRTRKRRELGLENSFVLGTVGRLSFQKNPEFTVEIFSEVKKAKKDAVLMFVGHGELEERVREKVAKLGLTDSVLFLGHRDDVPALLQAMDVFVLPSRFEGLGIVYVEAQAAGLQTFATANVVPQEARLSEKLFTFIPQLATAQQWAEKIALANTSYRPNTQELVRSKGYDICFEREKLIQSYIALLGGKDEKDFQ